MALLSTHYGLILHSWQWTNGGFITPSVPQAQSHHPFPFRSACRCSLLNLLSVPLLVAFPFSRRLISNFLWQWLGVSPLAVLGKVPRVEIEASLALISSQLLKIPLNLTKLILHLISELKLILLNLTFVSWGTSSLMRRCSNPPAHGLHIQEIIGLGTLNNWKQWTYIGT